jgi:hypothetical protein
MISVQISLELSALATLGARELRRQKICGHLGEGSTFGHGCATHATLAQDLLIPAIIPPSLFIFPMRDRERTAPCNRDTRKQVLLALLGCCWLRRRSLPAYVNVQEETQRRRESWGLTAANYWQTHTLLINTQSG